MLGDDADAVGGGVVFVVGLAADALDLGDDRDEQVGVVAGIDALHDPEQTLEAHAGVHAGRGQVGAGAVEMVVELHEHEVPQLDVAVAYVAVVHDVLAVGGAVFLKTAVDCAVVVVELGAWAAGTLVAGWPPPVLVVAVAVHAVAWDALGDPELAGLVVGVVHGGGELVEGDAVAVGLGHQLDGEVNGLFLEVVADAEVAEHLEQRVVGGVADLFDVGGAEALLRGGEPAVGRLGLAGEVGLELHHSGGGEQQCGVADGNQGRAGHPAVSLRLEVAEEGLS